MSEYEDKYVIIQKVSRSEKLVYPGGDMTEVPSIRSEEGCWFEVRKRCYKIDRGNMFKKSSRLIGEDTLYVNECMEFDEDGWIEYCKEQNKLILTKEKRLLKKALQEKNRCESKKHEIKIKYLKDNPEAEDCVLENDTSRSSPKNKFYNRTGVFEFWSWGHRSLSVYHNSRDRVLSKFKDYNMALDMLNLSITHDNNVKINNVDRTLYYYGEGCL